MYKKNKREADVKGNCVLPFKDHLQLKNDMPPRQQFCVAWKGFFRVLKGQSNEIFTSSIFILQTYLGHWPMG